MNEQTASIEIPSKPRTRDPLPRLSNEMAKDKRQKSPQLRNVSRSPNVMNRSNEHDYSPSPSRSRSSSADVEETDCTPEFNWDGIQEEFIDDEWTVKYFQTQTTKEIQSSSPNRKCKSRSPKLDDSTSGSTSVFTILCIILTILIGIWAFVPNVNNTAGTGEYREKPTRKEILKNVEEELRQLKKEFRNQEKNIWEEIYSGIIEVINNPMKPSIFVLFADSNDPMSCLATKIGELSRKALGTEKYLTLKPAELDADTGDVIDRLRCKIPKQKAVIVWDFLSINNEALKAFHNLCDRENPLIKEAIYIITVKVVGYDITQTPLNFIENQLKSNLTGRMDEDSIMPLVTRLTDGSIISVNPESNIKCPFENTLF